MTSKTTSKVSTTPAATQRNTEMWLKRLKEFQNDIGYVENIEDIQSKSQLCNILIEFIIKMRPVNKQYYSLESIYNCMSALNRYFQNHSAIAPLDLFSEPVFKPLLSVIHSKIRENEQLNSLDIKKDADPLTEDEQKQILCHSSMRGDNPEGLLRRVFFWIANLTATRGGSHINIMASDFQRQPDGGYNFIIIHEKNNQGGLNSRRKKGKTNQPRISIIPSDEFGTTNGPCHDISKYLRYDLKMQNPTFIYSPLVILKNLNNQDVDAQQIMAFSGHHSLAGVNAYRMPNEKQMMENITRSSEFTRNSLKVQEHYESIIGLKSTSTKEIESTKVTKRDKFKTPFKGKFSSPLIDLNKKVPSDDSQSSQNMTLDLEGMKVHIINCNVTINISKN
ncbi:unnamed protein product [Rhizophagus irregularis]|nr:unnamed protein product [Rhizophagus irregularis]